jgi:hypothetical protein
MFITKTKNYSQISLTELKEDLSISLADSTYDSQLRRLIKSSVDEAEKLLNEDIVNTNNVLEETSYIYPFTFCEYDVPNVNITITGITLTTNGVASSISNSNYYVERYNNYTKIKFKSAITGEKLLIWYTSGYPSIPESIKRAIILKCGEMLDVNRNNFYSNNLIESKAFKRLLAPFINFF